MSGSPDPDSEADSRSDRDGARSSRSRTVTVPLAVYKTVTVFSTLFAVIGVVAGFVLLDSATDRATADLAEVDPLLALLGLGLIVAAAITYAFSTRFQAEEMSKPKDTGGEGSDDG